jgi:hypothetical protein
MPAIGKADIVRRLARHRGYQRYLEITTSTTGQQYDAARAAGYEVCQRLVYRCPPDHDDGHPIDYRTEGEETSECVARIRSECRPFDIMLVDPHHTYECSIRDLGDALSLLCVGGTLVVHDCDPPDRQHAIPHYVSGAWCGVTYKAFLDFVIRSHAVEYFTIDTDYGCGVIRKLSRCDRLLSRARQMFMPTIQRRTESEWMGVGQDFDAAYTVFEAHRSRLLKLVGVDEFERRHPRVVPRPQGQDVCPAHRPALMDNACF